MVPVKLTHHQRAQLAALAEMPDEKIDYSDIAPLSAEFWKTAIANPLYKPTKTSTTVRVDSDVLAWLKSYGKGYQTRINAILRAEMVREVNRK